MTEEEKKEFEEFLQWKKEKAEKEQKEKSENNYGTSETKAEELLVEDKEREVELSTSDSEPENGESSISPLIIIAAVFIGLVIFLMFILKISSGGTQTQQAEQEYVAADSIEEVIEVEPVSTPTTKTWDFTIKKDEMTDTKNIWATIQSDDYIVQDFPYNAGLMLPLLSDI